MILVIMFIIKLYTQNKIFTTLVEETSTIRNF